MPIIRHVKDAMTSKDGPSTLTGALAMSMVKLQLDGVLSHVAFSGPRTSMIEALSFSGPVARLLVMRIRVFVLIPNTLLVCVFGHDSIPVHMSSWHLLVSSRC